MLRGWEEERQHLTKNYPKLKVVDLRNRLEKIWSEVGKSEFEIRGIKQMRKNVVCSHLIDYFKVMDAQEKVKSKMR